MSAEHNDAVRIILASPREPSGGSWLINCLLELGVRVNLKTAVDRVFRSVNNMGAPEAMWRPTEDGGWRLHPRATSLQKWLPILSRRETLRFRDGISVFYVQDLPREEFRAAHSVFFVRDPRDAIQSYYRRIRPGMSLDEFVRFPHPETLLDAIEHWRLFAESWMARDDVHVYRFEDYKADAAALLTRITADIGIDATPEEISGAVFESSYEKARAAEERYRREHPGDDEIAMRAGRVGEWKESPDLSWLSQEIEERTAALLDRLGYAGGDAAARPNGVDSRRQLPRLGFFNQVQLPEAWRAATVNREAGASKDSKHLLDTLSRISHIDADAINRARYHTREARLLLDSCMELCEPRHQQEQSRLRAIRARFDNGSEYQMARIRDLANQVKATIGKR